LRSHRAERGRRGVGGDRGADAGRGMAVRTGRGADGRRRRRVPGLGGRDCPGAVCADAGGRLGLGAWGHMRSSRAVDLLRRRVHGCPRADDVAAGAREPVDGARRGLRPIPRNVTTWNDRRSATGWAYEPAPRSGSATVGLKRGREVSMMSGNRGKASGMDPELAEQFPRLIGSSDALLAGIALVIWGIWTPRPVPYLAGLVLIVGGLWLLLHTLLTLRRKRKHPDYPQR